ncbi:hypothetical protein O0L34_g2415 [Tuta absoluta]|nr:hypothetical protein O0L34_g2415 [Tuta absoluta]
MNLVIIVCSCYLLMVQMLTTASKIAPNEQEYWSRAEQAAMLDSMDHLADLSLMMVRDMERGYAEKIRNDLMRNELYSLETIADATPRRRGAITKKNYSSFVPSCSCESSTETILLGEEYFPIGLQSQRCTGNCAPPYECKPVQYWVAVLKKVKNQQSGAHSAAAGTSGAAGAAGAPAAAGASGASGAAVVGWEWEPRRVNVTTSCVCAADAVTFRGDRN